MIAFEHEKIKWKLTRYGETIFLKTACGCRAFNIPGKTDRSIPAGSQWVSRKRCLSVRRRVPAKSTRRCFNFLIGHIDPEEQASFLSITYANGNGVVVV